MALTTDAGDGDVAGVWFVADRRLWLTAGRDRVVEDGDPDAASLYATPGKRVPRVDAERYGLTDASVVKKADPAEDKMAVAREDKGHGRRQRQ